MEGGASYNTMDRCLVVTDKAYFQSTSVMAPDSGGKHDWIEFLVWSEPAQVSICRWSIHHCNICHSQSCLYKSRSGAGVHLGRRKKLWPDQGVAKAVHQWMSRRNPSLRVIVSWSCAGKELRLIVLQRKVRMAS